MSDNDITTISTLVEALAESARLLAEVPNGAGADALRLLAREANAEARQADALWAWADRCLDEDSDQGDHDTVHHMALVSTRVDALRDEVVRLALRAEAVANGEAVPA